MLWPGGMHLPLSAVQAGADGSILNETAVENTLDRVRRLILGILKSGSLEQFSRYAEYHT